MPQMQLLALYEVSNQNDRDVIRDKLIVANISVDELYGKGKKLSLPLKASLHLPRSQ